jgi:hypothetical protein
MTVGDSVENLKNVRLRLGEPSTGSIYNGHWRQQAMNRTHKRRTPTYPLDKRND